MLLYTAENWVGFAGTTKFYNLAAKHNQHGFSLTPYSVLRVEQVSPKQRVRDIGLQTTVASSSQDTNGTPHKVTPFLSTYLL